jgi:hypothetical protein
MLPIHQRTCGHQLNDIISPNLIIIPRLEEDTEGWGGAASSRPGRQMARQDGARQLLHILVVGLALVLGIWIWNQIGIFSGLPDPDPLVKDTNPDPSLFS